MKHWAYIGLVLVLGQESLIGGARAAELMIPPDPTPSAKVLPLTDRIIRWWQKPPQRKVITPVVVRLFSTENTQNLWLKHPTGVLLSGRKVKGTIYFTHRDGKVHAFKGKRRLFAARQLKIIALDDQPLLLKNKQGVVKRVLGQVRIGAVKGRLKIVNRTELEDYALGILEGELGSLRLNPELLKAQAVAARSYVLSMRNERHRGQGYEYCDSPHCQVFRGVASFEKMPELKKALASIKGQYLTYAGRPICAFYHHSCGGLSSSANEVWPMSRRGYLVAVPEDEKGVCRISPANSWQARFPNKKLTLCFRKAGWLKKNENFSDVQIVQKDSSGRVKQIQIVGKKQVTVSIGRFRNTLNSYFGREYLRSALFSVSVDKNAVVFQGRGWGHGVGFCQEGARWLANKGKSYEKILQHYFPNTRLERLS